MTARRRNWLAGIVLVVLVAAAALAIAASMLAAHIAPYARQAAIDYLSRRFNSDVQLRELHVRLPHSSVLRLVLTRRAVPLFEIAKFHADVDVESLLQHRPFVSGIVVDGMQIELPPRVERPRAPYSKGTAADNGVSSGAGVTIAKVTIRNAALVLQPRNPRKLPLRFEIQNLKLESVRAGAPMKYDASLTNAKPPGNIYVTGTFGPWQAAEPGDTPVSGDYLFENADLGVFAGIAGTLNSTGRFEGQLSALTVHGKASVPNFSLRLSGNRVPLVARFTALVDGTNGNTILQPVTATLGSTNFTTSGGIVKHEANQPRAISLTVAMPNGDLRDVLRLAMKGSPFMEGRLALNTKIDIPPLTGKVREKLVLDGSFQVLQGKFLHSTIQNQIDNLSKRASGQVQNPDTELAVSQMTGAFYMEDAAIRFSKLSFGLPGAALHLAGDYNLDSDALDFGGTLKLQATVSQMVTGWKSVLLKPVDRLFQRDGAGTFLHIRVDGTAKDPKLGVIIAGKKLEAPLPKR